MIRISVDEAAAFDMLAILGVKVSNGMPDIFSLGANLCEEISNEIGGDKTLKIVFSKEYFRLLDVNGRIFDAVGLASEGKVEAKYVHDLNQERHAIKQELQKKFFGSVLTEQKTN